MKGDTERAQRIGDLTWASQITHGDLPEDQRELEAAKAQLTALQNHGALLKEEVTEEDIARIVSSWTGIPVSRVQEG